MPINQLLNLDTMPASLRCCLHIKGNSRHPSAHPAAVQRGWEAQLPSCPRWARLQQTPTAAASAGADPGRVPPGTRCWALAAPPAPLRQQWLWLAARPQSAGQASGVVLSGIAWCPSAHEAPAWCGTISCLPHSGSSGSGHVLVLSLQGRQEGGPCLALLGATLLTMHWPGVAILGCMVT